ncbi:hypothetical protein AAG570_011115 [Ranatra chinensis]|uniref:Uncharacterized protein n=1 Tax=Ranatra chinensis TaxID=642074 RepID=A0ABD0Z5Y6_9HEMI
MSGEIQGLMCTRSRNTQEQLRTTNVRQGEKDNGVNWNDWYSPIYDRSNRWLSSLVRKLPFSFDPKELKIIYPNNKKDTLYTPYSNLKAGEKKSRPLSLTTTMSTTEADSTRDTVDDVIKGVPSLHLSYFAQTQIPMPKEHEFLDYKTKRPRRKPTGYMGYRRFLSTRYEPEDRVDDVIKGIHSLHLSYPAETQIPMPKEHEFLDYKTKRPRRKPTGYMGNRRFLSNRFEPGDTVDDVIKETKSEREKRTMGVNWNDWYSPIYDRSNRWLSSLVRKLPFSFDPKELKIIYPNNKKDTLYTPYTKLKAGEKKSRPLSLTTMEKRTMGVNWNDWYSPIYDRSNRWLSSLVRKLPFSFDPKELKIIYPNNKKDTLYTPYTKLKAGEKKSRPLSLTTMEKRTMGVNWNDWYSPIYDRSNTWLSSLVRKLPFSFDPKELKIIYPNNKKDTLYTPYTNLKAGEKKSRPLSLTTIKTFMQLLIVRGKAIDTPYNAGGNNRAVIPATPQGFDIPHHHNPFSGMPVSGIRSFENSFAAIPDDCPAGDPRSFPDEPLSKPSTDCTPA